MGDILIFLILLGMFIIFIGSLITGIFNEIIKSKYGIVFIFFVDVALLYLVTFILPRYETCLGISKLGIQGLQLLIFISILCFPLKLLKGLI